MRLLYVNRMHSAVGSILISMCLRTRKLQIKLPPAKNPQHLPKVKVPPPELMN